MNKYSTENMIEERKRTIKALRESAERYMGRITVLGVYNVSPGVIVALQQSWKGIKDCKDFLQKHGIPVSDEPNDMPPPEDDELSIAMKDVVEKMRMQAIKEAHERSDAMQRERGYDTDTPETPPPPPPKPPAPKAVNLSLFDLMNPVDEKKNPVDESRADEDRIDEGTPDKEQTNND